MSAAPLLIVEDDAELREALCDTLAAAGFAIADVDSGEAALEFLASRRAGLVISDVQMQPMDGNALLAEIRRSYPELPVVMMTAYGTVQRAVDAMRAGAADYLVKPFDADVLTELARKYLRTANAQEFGDLVVADERSRQLAELAARVAGSDVTVMISGESGSGKEMFARFVHSHSARAKGPFVAINCAAIPENMLEAVLFGHEKGAFTGAVSAHAGKFEQAAGGTLLLDEISEMGVALQAKLLRVLQEREVERLGGRRTIPLDVRVLATTNRVLREEVAAGRFREDLFYRLNVFPLHLPPLRERPGDILPLAARLVAQHSAAARVVPQFSPAAVELLEAHAWPGNVRELDNLIQRTLILSTDSIIEARDLNFETHVSPVDIAAHAPAMSRSSERPLASTLKKNEEQLIVEALKAGQGSRKAAAAKLGISPRTLRYKLARLRDAGVELPGTAINF